MPETSSAARPRILACFLCGSERDSWLNPSLLPAAIQMTHDARCIVNVEVVTEHPVSRARNHCVMQARKQNADWLLMIDNDQGLPAARHSILDVIAEAGTHQDVIGLPSAMVGESGLRWNANFLEPVGSNPFVSVDCIGSGVMLLRSSVWQRIPAGPWFETHYTNDGELGPKISVGEDASFCRLARSAGLEIWATQFASPHLKTTDLTSQLIQQHRQLQQVPRA